MAGSYSGLVTVKLLKVLLLLSCVVTTSVVADECTEMLELYIQELKESLDERVDYSQPQAVTNSVIELAFIEKNRHLISDCELANGILVIEPKNEDNPDSSTISRSR
ncbi:hypothetical protein OPS25_13645 [Alteromonas ponticola]|uniref:Uncharacterized protein n=1 Tax=Alteromonas aquimaris TaxID=2998417 RepID=A0ABT3PA15_9ALTE|nr:hypothetical protein [Alteromonas aquimaris]MCW8109549.1 hypothetical protein [Alteromonas aquimaris]